MKNIKLKQFEGPFDLLLSLIDEQKLDISELAISEVTEQYLEHLDKLGGVKPEELADFLVVATKLLLLKSRLLLPQLSVDEDDGPNLEDQLKLYKAFLEASKKINKLWLSGHWGAWRIEPPRRSKEFVPPENLTMENLRESMVQLLSRLKPPKALPQTYIDKAVTMKEKIDCIRRLLKMKKTFSFSEILSSSENRTEVIMGFLALLELVKGKVVGLKQEGSFGGIVVEKAE
jgi:segregation and condensation protein A